MLNNSQLNPKITFSASDEELDLYLHLCPERVHRLFWRNNIALPPMNATEAREVLFVLLGLKLDIVINNPVNGRIQGRAFQLIRNDRIIDQEPL